MSLASAKGPARCPGIRSTTTDITGHAAQEAHREPSLPDLLDIDGPRTRPERSGTKSSIRVGRPGVRSVMPVEYWVCRVPVARRNEGFVDPDRAHPGQPLRVLDQRSAVMKDLGHDRVPGHAELGGDPGHGPVVMADSPGVSPLDPTPTQLEREEPVWVPGAVRPRADRVRRGGRTRSGWGA